MKMDGMTKDDWYLGCDIGGTFTDFVLCEANRRELRKFKLLTTPGDPSDGFLEGVRMLGGEVENLLPQTKAVMHATTLAINAIIERKGAPTALITTAGFRDVLEIGREKRYDMHDIFQTFPDPLIPRRWRFEIPERLYADGTSTSTPSAPWRRSLTLQASPPSQSVSCMPTPTRTMNVRRQRLFRGIFPR